MKPQTILKVTTLLAAAGSLAMSVFLYFKGTGEFHRLDGIYVGVWVPSILSLGAFLVAGQEKAKARCRLVHCLVSDASYFLL